MRRASPAAAALLAAACAAADTAPFAAWKAGYGVSYADPAEEALRAGLFAATLRRVAARNADAGDGAVYGATRWADRAPAEMRARCGGTARNGTRVTARRGVTGKKHAWDGTCYAQPRFAQNCDTSKKVPDAWDWSAHGAVTAVKDQGQCGNCFAFGGTGDMEAAWYLAGHDLVSLSEQQITSCDRLGGDGGCDGGDTNLDTDEYAAKNGITSESNYPYCSGHYIGKDACPGVLPGGKCDKAKAAQAVAHFTSGYQVSGGDKGCDWCDKQPLDEGKMKEHLFRAGPLSIGINSGPFDDYKKGILSLKSKKCSPKFDDLDHQVMIVGYGTAGGVDYWKVKNSWGTDWGESGYIRIARGSNTCGIAADATHIVASAAAPQPPAPPPAAAQYVCDGGACTESGSGITRAECEQSCVAPALYKCDKGKCAATAGGIAKSDCEKICV